MYFKEKLTHPYKQNIIGEQDNNWELEKSLQIGLILLMDPWTLFLASFCAPLQVILQDIVNF